MKFLTIILAAVVVGQTTVAQIDTTSFPKERQEVRALLQQRKPGGKIDCNDFIAVGAKGDISYSQEQWQAVQQNQKIVFKSVTTLPGSEIIRVYDAKMAVVNFVLAVSLVVDDKPVNLKVRRLEIFHKSAEGWCRVAGQGTEIDEKMFPWKGN